MDNIHLPAPDSKPKLWERVIQWALTPRHHYSQRAWRRLHRQTKGADGSVMYMGMASGREAKS